MTNFERISFDATERSQHIENILIFLGIILGAVVGCILVLDIPIIANKHLSALQTREAIAELIETENTVRHKPGALPVWNVASRSNSLAFDDQIFTDTNSSAKIAFKDKSVIDLGQNSLIVLRRQNDEKLIDIKHGTINATLDTAGSIILEVNNVKSRLSTTSKAHVTLQANANGGLSLAVLDGDLKLESNNKKVNIHKNQATFLNAKQEIAPIEDINIVPVEPLNEATLLERPSIRFVWKASKPDRYLFELSTTQDFSQTTFKTTLDKSSIDVPNIVPGLYFWRVNPVVNKQSTSLVRKLAVIPRTAPELIYPALGEVLEVPQVYFDWQKQPQINQYVIEISEDQNFKNKKSLTADVSPALSPTLKDGKYFWRARGLVGQQSQDWSNTGTFKILTQKVEAPITPPKLQKNYEFNPSNDPKSPQETKQGAFLKHLLNLIESSAYAATSPDAIIEWDPVVNATGYEAQIAKDSAFKTIILERSLPEPKIDLGTLSAGTYFIRVRSIHKNGAKSPYSEPSTVHIAFPELSLLAPARGAEHLRTTDTTPIEFSWHPIQGIQTYTFEVFRDKNLRLPIINEKISGTTTTRTFTKEGVYFWRVGIDQESKFSEVREFRISNEKPGVPSPPSTVFLKNSDPNVPVCPQVETPVCKKTAKSISSPSSTSSTNSSFVDRSDNFFFQLAMAPTSLEVISSTSTNRESLDLTAFNSAEINARAQVTQQLGIELGYGLLSTTLFRKNSTASTPSQPLKISNFDGSLTFQSPLQFFNAYLKVRLGYASTQLVTIERDVSNIAKVKYRSLNGPVFGLGLEKGLSKSLWISGMFNYLYARPPGASKSLPKHFLFDAQLTYAWFSTFDIGLGYSIESGNYEFTKSAIKESVQFRKQSIQLILGTSL